MRRPAVFRARRLVVLLACSAAAGIPVIALAAPLNEPIRPLPEKVDVDPAKVALGKRLFFDTRFSRDDKVSCGSCHDFSKGGADGQPRSPGVDGRLGPVNSPTVFNAGFNFRQLWNGKAGSLEEQVDMAITSPNVFDSNWDSVLAKLRSDAALMREFRQIYPEGLTRRNAANALAEFERSLVTPSRFDAYLRGNADAITNEEKQGYAKFKSYGCVACHQGVNIGGNMFQVFGVMRPYLGQSTEGAGADLGRYQVTGRESDKYVFKVPSLRNVALTAPYFHNASARTLEEAVDVMIRYQLGRTASPEDKALIVKFLHALTGTLPAHARQGAAR